MQKTAYEMRISDWSSDVCSSDLAEYVHEFLRGRTSGAEHLMGLGVFSSAQRYSYLGPALMTEQADGVQNSVIDPYRRSEERRVGKECHSKSRSGWSPYN